MRMYERSHGSSLFCKTCNQGVIDGELFLIDGECETCVAAHQESTEMWEDWENDAVS